MSDEAPQIEAQPAPDRFEAGYTLTEQDAIELGNLARLAAALAEHSFETGFKLGNFLSAHDVERSMLAEIMEKHGISRPKSRIFAAREQLASIMPTIKDDRTRIVFAASRI